MAHRIHRGGEMHWVGDGFPVRSVFSYNGLGQELSPFLLMDYAAPYEFTPTTQRRGVGAHPHRGFETVTICYQGEIEHRDSFGGGGKIGPGDVQWMTAASGLLHDEFHSPEFAAKGGTFEMIQLWVNLPAKNKNAEPGYQTLLKDSIPTVEIAGGAGSMRVIAGSYNGQNGPARTFTPVHIWDGSLNAGGEVTLSITPGYSTVVLVLRGELDFEGEQVMVGDLIQVDSEANQVTLTASSDAKFVVLSGQPLNEPIIGYGPFVMNTEQEIQQAFADFRAGKMGSL